MLFISSEQLLLLVLLKIKLLLLNLLKHLLVYTLLQVWLRSNIGADLRGLVT